MVFFSQELSRYIQYSEKFGYKVRILRIQCYKTITMFSKYIHEFVAISRGLWQLMLFVKTWFVIQLKNCAHYNPGYLFYLITWTTLAQFSSRNQIFVPINTHHTHIIISYSPRIISCLNHVLSCSCEHQKH